MSACNVPYLPLSGQKIHWQIKFKKGKKEKKIKNKKERRETKVALADGHPRFRSVGLPDGAAPAPRDTAGSRPGTGLESRGCPEIRFISDWVPGGTVRAQFPVPRVPPMLLSENRGRQPPVPPPRGTAGGGCLPCGSESSVMGSFVPHPHPRMVGWRQPERDPGSRSLLGVGGTRGPAWSSETRWKNPSRNWENQHERRADGYLLAPEAQTKRSFREALPTSRV